LWFASCDLDIDHADGQLDSSVVTLSSPNHSWTVTLSQSGLLVGDIGGAVDATVYGSPPALLLALSGRDMQGIGAQRFGLEVPVVEGNAAAFQRLLARLGTF
jgi:hypothetical protein